MDINNFAGTNGFYNQNYSHLPAYSSRKYMYHEGVDFTGRKGTPIISLIASEVVPGDGTEDMVKLFLCEIQTVSD